MRIIQVDTVYAQGSTGKIVETLHLGLQNAGYESKVYYGRGARSSDSNTHKISTDVGVYVDAGLSRVTGYTGIFSPIPTRRIISDLEKFKPDLVHLHEVHGYYINFIPLIEYLIERKIPIVWTLHCEFVYTGRCGTAFECSQWKTACVKCPQLSTYPSSWFFDRSAVQFQQKKTVFTNIPEVTFVPVSKWVESRLQQSFLKSKKSCVIHNGIDTKKTFKPSEYSNLASLHQTGDRYTVLSVAPDLMSNAKGGKWVLELAKRSLDLKIIFIMIGVLEENLAIPDNVIVMPPVKDQKLLASYYSMADLFLITSPSETFSLTCAESLACGTPIIGYDSGGPAEVAPNPFGYFVPINDINSLFSILGKAYSGDLGLASSDECVNFAATHYSNERMFQNYLNTYLDVTSANNNRPHISSSRPFTLNPSVDKEYQICSNCIMDSSDPNIIFDERGWCDYCNNYESTIAPNWRTDSAGYAALMQLADQIKIDGKGKEFDCIIGLSGGLDSSYTAFVAKEKMGLRPLLVHVDAGWNTDQAVGNIEKLVDGLGLELYTEVINWQEMKDLQLAFLRSGIPDQDLPQDAAFFSGLYKFARTHGIKHVITGFNFSTECCREPEEWGGYLGIDKMLFNDIHRQFGKIPLKTFPLTDILVYKLWYQRILGMKVHYPLNFVPFIKADAENELEARFGWKRFQHKHYESRFTRFYEDYWLPRRFGFHKRRAHFSSLIMTKQMTRAEALERISHPEMDEHFLEQEFEYVAHKLDISVDELQEIFNLPKKPTATTEINASLLGSVPIYCGYSVSKKGTSVDTHH